MNKFKFKVVRMSSDEGMGEEVIHRLLGGRGGMRYVRKVVEREYNIRRSEEGHCLGE